MEILFIEYSDGENEIIIHVNDVRIMNLFYPVFGYIAKLSTKGSLKNVNKKYYGIKELMKISDKWCYFDDGNYPRFNKSKFVADFMTDRENVIKYIRLFKVYESYIIREIRESINDLFHKHEIDIHTFNELKLIYD